MSNNTTEVQNKKNGLGRGLGSLLGGPGPSEKSVTKPVAAVPAPALTPQFAKQPANVTTNLQPTPINTAHAQTSQPMPPIVSTKQEAIVAVTKVSVNTQTPTPSVVTEQAASIDPESKIWKVGVDKLSPGQFQPRRTFEK
jgi:ParB family chromosome partitioning protein